MYLITGAAGWLGVNLVKAVTNGIPNTPIDIGLATPEEIRCFVLPGTDVSRLYALYPNIKIVFGDLTNQVDCENFCRNAEGATLLHIAGIIHPGKVKEFYDINVRGTENLLQAAVKNKVKKAVIMSSNSPIGLNPDNKTLFDENAPYNPYMNYGRSKMQMELAVKKIQQEGKIETCIIRSPWFYGPEQPARQLLFFKMIKEGKVPIVGNGENIRSMAYVDNISQGMLLAATNPSSNGKVFWIADERPYTMNEIVDTIEEVLESEFNIQCAHKRVKLPSVISEVALITDGLMQKLGLYNQKIHVLSEMNKNIACTVDKAKKELGYQPSIALKEGMKRSIASLDISVLK
jgi:nucleoside-diphosphate-sugar epimerase